MTSPEVISLGCRLNLAEGERMKSMLSNEGNMIVINSCAVTTEAVRQTRQAIRRARSSNPTARLLVTGCAADIEREQISNMPEVDGLIANADKLDRRSWNAKCQPQVIGKFRTRAFIGVQNGCDHACTFCVIPEGRGQSRSNTIDNVKWEVEQHLKLGAKEVILTGVDVTSWGHDLPGNLSLGNLVNSILNEFPELPRLRMSSVDGVELDESLLGLFSSEPRLMPHIHLSLQHGHNLILKRMKRRHTLEQAVDLVCRIKRDRPEIAIGADLIAGFPTESREHHLANLAIIRECRIVHGHIFPYSQRPGTPAAKMPQVDRAIVKQRAAELRLAVSKVRSKWLNSLIGKKLNVLTESDGTGYAENYARVAVPANFEVGQIVSIYPEKSVEGMLI